MTRIKTSDSSHPDLTKQQTARIEYLRRRYAPRDGYEFKTNEIWLEDWDSPVRSYRFVYLIIKTGLVGDEGTLAEAYARDRRFFSIGPKGGTKTWNGKRWLPGATWDQVEDGLKS